MDIRGEASVIDIAKVQDIARAAGLELAYRADVLTLSDGTMDLCADFSRMLPRIKPGRLQKELLVRAARCRGVESPHAIDATAGFGEDSFLLAAAGFQVDLFERDEVIAALLADALSRATSDDRTAAIATRMTLHTDDSVTALRAMAECDESPDVVYLDPMFPGRTKSAAVKKKFQLLHHLERPCEDEEGLVAAALDVHPRKLVIKRPPKGPLLAGIKPSYQISGKAVRYDVIVH